MRMMSSTMILYLRILLEAVLRLKKVEQGIMAMRLPGPLGTAGKVVEAVQMLPVM